jgi:hypothetical protein
MPFSQLVLLGCEAEELHKRWKWSMMTPEAHAKAREVQQRYGTF